TVSLATVSNVVGELLEQNVLIEAGVEDSEGGRPRTVLQINPSYGYVVGVDIGETGVLVELFDLGMEVLASHTSVPPTSAALDPDTTVAQVVEGLDYVIAKSGVDSELILGVGVGVPGLVSHGIDAVVDAQTVGWENVPFGKMLRRSTSLPLLVDNGAKNLGQAEKWFGAARTADNAIIVLFGTGIGTCIITDGERYRGSSSSAGEWGHTSVVVNGRTCPCGASGCLEAYAGAPAIVARYDELRRRPSRPGSDDVVARLTAIANAGPRDGSAARVLEETATYLGTAIADLINLFNPERIVVGGWAGTVLGERLLSRVREIASTRALRLPFSQVAIVPAELDLDAVALGAATLPMSQFLASGAAPITRGSRGRQVRAERVGTSRS
ncbi:MAG TPA: ROK family protein, partial [Acidothermaceae bacterium]|nr:ROK family protein [Acidothermaceae bacterium]